MKNGSRLSAETAPPGQPAAVLLVGCGAVSQRYYAPALESLERAGWVRVAALYDPDAAMRAVLERRFPAAAPLSELVQLRGSKIELAILASPPMVHARQAIELLESGVAVLCEKPLATSVADARSMVEAAARSGAVLAAGMLRRFFPATQAIRKMLGDQLLGTVTAFDFQEGHNFRWPVSSASYFRRDTAGGGVLMDLGAHALDLLLWWFGQPAEIVYEDDAMGGVEVNCRLRCQFPSGLAGQVRLSRDCTLANRYRISGSKGSVTWIVNEANRLQLSFDGAPYDLEAMLALKGAPAATFERSFIDQICNLIAAVKGKSKLHVPAAEVLPSLRLIERCYAERSLMPMPWLDTQETQRAAELHRASR